MLSRNILLMWLIIIIMVNIILDLDSFSQPNQPSTPSYVLGSEMKTLITSPIQASESHSTEEYNLGPQEPAITIEKYIDGVEDTCNKNDNITIELRFINCDQTNTIKSVAIMEEIPKGFKFINAYPNDAIVNNSMIEWRRGEDLKAANIDYLNYFSYTIQAEESGRHIIPSTIEDS